jgi:hypothetical protein
LQVQASGHVLADPRWSRVAPEVVYNGFQRQTAQPLEEKIRIPRVHTPGHGHCIYVTPRKDVVLTPEKGSTSVLVQFDLPRDILPSFRGLLASTSYYLTIFVWTDKEDADEGAVREGEEGAATDKHGDEVDARVPHVTHFSFWATGGGSTQAKQFVRFSDILAHATPSFPAEHCFLPLGASSSSSEGGNEDGSFEGENDGGDGPVSTYTIRDEGVVALVSCPLVAYPGRCVYVFVDLSKSEQKCVGIRTNLFLCEMRPDGSVVQNKVISSARSMTANALCIHLRLDVPGDVPCSFQSPLQGVSYRLEFQFLAQETGEFLAQKASASARAASAASAGTDADAGADADSVASAHTKTGASASASASASVSTHSRDVPTPTPPNELNWSIGLEMRALMPAKPNRASLMACLEPAPTAFLAKASLTA